MKALVKIASICSVPLLLLSAAQAQAPDEFRPFKLVGDWKFQNARSGVNYRGDIEVSVSSRDPNGVMRGSISYDGRQTNEKCSTRGLVNDTPVPAEIVRSDDTYRITFRVPCSVGESPRDMSWTLTCKGGVCELPIIQPWGKGRTSLTVKN